MLYREKFYEKTLIHNYSEVYNWIQLNIFGNKPLVQKWMKGQISSVEVNRLIAKNANIDLEILSSLYHDSVSKIKLDSRIEKLVRALKSAGQKVEIVTDNMEVFTQIIVPEHGLNKLFEVIINSANYGLLKQEVKGKLFDKALAA